MSKLAIDGGKPIRVEEFKKYNTIGLEEKNAVAKVMDTGVLSAYFGKAGNGFLGGERVQEFEKLGWCCKACYLDQLMDKWFGNYDFAMDFESGEIITSPWTMCATAAAMVHAGHSDICRH